MKLTETMAEIAGRAILSVAVLAAALPISAAECVWTGPSGNWGDASGWNGGVKPSAAGDTVKITGDGVTVTVTDSDIANFQLVTAIAVESADSRIVVDTAGDVTSPAEFSGGGKLVKTGASELFLSYPGVANSTYGPVGRIGELVISNGVVRMPDRTLAAGLSNGISLPRFSVWKPGILSLGNTPYTYCPWGIRGDGTITNANSGCQLSSTCFGITDDIPVFSGKLEPNVEFTISRHDNTHVPAVQYMSGEGSDRDISLRLDGVVGITKFGMIGGRSPLGSRPDIQLRSYSSKIICLGNVPEETDRNISFGYNCALGTVDAGAYGGVTFRGQWFISAYSGWGDGNYKCNTVCLTGSNTVPCVVACVMYDKEDRAATYWRKEGTGTWRFSGSIKDMMGTFDVRRGTLQFDSLAEKGVRCALGLSTMTYEDASHLADRTLADMESRKVPYAFRLGDENLDETTEALATLEYVGESPVKCSTRPIAVTGAGRIMSTGGDLNLAGAMALGTGTGTLVLDGTGNDVFSSVTNGSGSLSVVKRGSGTWRLEDDIDVDSAIAEEGTLEIGSRYTWYRWTITANNGGAGNAWIASFNGFALMDAAGNVVNGTLGSKGMATSGRPDLLEPGQMCYYRHFDSTGNRIPSNSFWWLPDEEKFYGGPAAIDITVKPDDSSTHPVIYFRPDAGVEVHKYDILSDTAAAREVAYWELAGSTDGANWTPLHVIDATTGTPAPFSSQLWYSTGTAERGGYVIPPGKADAKVAVGAVGVRAGGVLRFIGTSVGKEVSSLVIDAADPGGTIEGVSFPAEGVLEIRNWSDQKIDVDLPVDLTGCTGCENISGWRLSLDGNASGKCIIAGKDGVRIRRRGLLIGIR